MTKSIPCALPLANIRYLKDWEMGGMREDLKWKEIIEEIEGMMIKAHKMYPDIWNNFSGK